MVCKKNLVKRKFPYIDTIDHEVSTVVSAMRDLTVGVFEHFDITSLMYIYQMVAYTQCILRGALLLKYTTVLVECKHSPKELVGDKWDLVALKGLSTDDLWGWAKKYGIGYYRDA